MNCPKCKDEYQEDNFCSNCGNQIKEKCPECGEMEFVGRLVCETLIKKIRKEQNCYMITNIFDFHEHIMTLILVGLVIVVLGFIQTESGAIPFFGIIVMGLAALDQILFLSKIKPKLTLQAEWEFFRLHPDYAEILKKAEKGEKNETAD